MSNFEDTFYEDEDDDQPSSETNPVRARMKQLEKENRGYKKQLAEAQVTQRELAFVKAGIDPDSPQAKYFVKGYDGDLTTEAIREAAVEAQLITSQYDPHAEDRAGWKQSNKIAAGAETTANGSSWNKKIREASSEDELMSIFAEAQAQGVNLGEL
jgi:hypothetical protein